MPVPASSPARAPVARPAVAIAACLACAASLPARAAPECSLPGAGAWREYRSAHFVLATDVSRERAARLVAELEEQHALVLAALFGPGTEVPGRMRVVAFSSPRHFGELAPSEAAGYVTSDSFGELVAVFPYSGREPVPEVVAHELAHRVSFFHFPRQPPWFREGLAAFVQSVARERADDRAAALGSHLVRGDRRSGGRWAGLASPELLAGVAATTPVDALELLSWRGDGHRGDPGRFHAASWVLYHWLWNHRSRQFTAYQEALARGDDPDDAWRAAFPEWDPRRPETLARLDRALAAYRKQGRYAPYRVEATGVDAAFAEAALPPAELHLLLLDIRAPSRWPADAGARAALLVAQLEEALREDAAHPVAIHALAQQRGEPLAPALRAATAARPGDWRGWVLLSRALDGGDGAEREAALRKAAALAPDSAHAQNALAWLLVTSGRAREARPFAERARDLAPWSPAILDTLAAVAMGLGQCRPAVVLQRRAAALFPPDEAAGEGVRARLAQYEAACAPAAETAR